MLKFTIHTVKKHCGLYVLLVDNRKLLTPNRHWNSGEKEVEIAKLD